MRKHSFAACLAVFLFFSFATAQSVQKAEVTVGLNEAFFDALLDSVFQNLDPPRFTIAQEKTGLDDLVASFLGGPSETPSTCDESVKLLREINGVRTAVRFREGRIYVPLAFSGNYEPPFVGCVEFTGWAETNIDLEVDQTGQRLVGRVRVVNVNLNGTGGIGGTMIAKLLQRSIDKNMNPIEIMKFDKLSFLLPIPNSGTLRMKATGVQSDVANGSLNIKVAYEFSKP